MNTVVHLAPCHYKPESQEGQKLIGHELTHVVQQKEGRVSAKKQGAGMPINDDPGLQKEADEMGARAAQGKMADVQKKGSGVQKQDQEDQNVTSEELRLKLKVLGDLQTISEIKRKYLDIWYEEAKKKDTKWGAVILESVLSIALGALTAGVAGVISAHVTRNLSGLVQEGVKSAAGNIIQDLIKVGTSKIQTAAAQGLSNSSSSLLGKYNGAAWAQFTLEKDDYNGMAINCDNIEVLRAVAQTMEQTKKDLFADGAPIMQQVTMGYLNFQDNVYISDKAGVSADDDEKTREEKIGAYKEANRDVVEEQSRSGRLHFKGKVEGDPANPTLAITKGYYSDMYNGTANLLKGMKFSDLNNLTISFYLDAKDCNWDFWTGDIMARAPIVFEIGPNGTFVDMDRNGDSENHVYKEGAEWLANYYMGFTPSEKYMLTIADWGAKKIFETLIKDKSVPKLHQEDWLF